WFYECGGKKMALGVPVAELDGTRVALVCAGDGRVKGFDDLRLECVFQTLENSPVARFKFILRSDSPRRLGNYVRYVSAQTQGTRKEVQFGAFNEHFHTYIPVERELAESDFGNNLRVMGPMLCWSGADGAGLVAYEHGSQSPNAFLEFALEADGKFALEAVKANTVSCQGLDAATAFESVWFDVALAADEASLAAAFRDFVLRGMCPNTESRKPYIFYNSWCYQERNKWWNKQTFIGSMNEERMLAEIEVAHKLGVEVFVLDTGWYEKTGDWRVSGARFPNGLAPIKAKLDAYGMKMGLWFNPVVAAKSSAMCQNHLDCLMTTNDVSGGTHVVWETEASHDICIVSRYWEAFADELIRLVREVGVTYFKWDAIGQYGCDCSTHFHGDKSNTPEERRQSYAFEQVRYMNKVVDKLCKACPDAIVDFDITEGGRCVGLGFLASGKYFLINNGPYFHDLDFPKEWAEGVWSNTFVHPGPARARVCRAPLGFDKWIPSVLFLTHYLPDDPARSQLENTASMILGQNGFWGDLLTISDDGVARIREWLDAYKKVRDDITAVGATRVGDVGGSPEIYEKINPANGRGVVVIFASARGNYKYVTRSKTATAYYKTDGIAVREGTENRAILEIAFKESGAQMVFFA
ncbi:MAG: alpha-galactosidase, partial [Kiritimatiellaeota bacterium]|nr:alpha-galactosidase [Kiritimatiellota bacterium]